MKRSNAVILLLFAIATISSCKKSVRTTPAIQSTLYIPWNVDTLFATIAAELDLVPFSNVSGVLAAGRISGSLIDTSGHINIYNRNWEYAIFASPFSPATIKAGNVSVNTAALTPFNNAYKNYDVNSYVHYDTSIVWNDSASNHWAVTGNDTIPTFTASIDGAYPSFIGALPINISNTSDFSFTFNSSNTINGDSAFIVLYEAGAYYTSNIVSTNGGMATISSVRLVHATNDYVNLNALYLTASPLYYGGFIDIVIYNHTIQTFGGKQFAFVKMREVLGVVNFL